MATLINKAAEKIPSLPTTSLPTTSEKPKRKPSSKSRSPKTSPSNERSIPHEPVQTKPHGDWSEHDAQPAMQVHNLARANKSCKKLEWSGKLAREAEAYAQKLAESGKLEHSGTEGQGENLYMKSGEAEMEEAVESWLAEERVYKGERVGEGEGGWGHFSQCLWSTTTHVGMGKAKAKNGSTYVVARYSPPGNVVGQKPFSR